ncbi:MAG: cbb3-type cytochrome c oxidase subunit I [Candidatus Lambdaproteobacteria bacterium]|nr:cbb3-type cytochrome c oxidase subunit I [Candidatus Lambdaproteobacteria bacterium]
MSAGTIAAAAGLFRTCPVTKLKVHRDAELLVKVNAVAAVLAFTVGVSAAILLVLTRWQAVHLLPADWYYRLVTAHGLNMLIFFIIFFEMAILYFAGAIMLNSRVPTPWLAWLSFGLMAVGALLVDYLVFTGRADVLFTSYPPLRAHPLYYLGIILFAVGALVVTGLFFACLVVARREKTYEGSMPLVVFGALTAAIISVVTLVHGAIIYIPTFLWSLDLEIFGWKANVDAQVYRMIWWALGHSSQQINVAAMVSVWYLLGGITVGAVVINEKISRTAFVLYILFINLASAHHLLVDPGFGPGWKIWNTSYFMYLAVLASMIHGFTVPAGVEVGQRLNGFVKGTFEWLRKAPWSDPGFSGMFLSLIIFGFLGGVTGVTIGTEQISIIAHNTLRVPGHFHTTVVGGTALAFMALTYYVIPLIFRREVIWLKLARYQPYLFGGGVTLFAVSMIVAGMFGVPRRHYDISFTNALFKVEYPPGADLALAFLALGGIVAFLGGLLYILITVGSVFFGTPLTEERLQKGLASVPQGILRLPPQERKEESHYAPGTVILVFVFLAVFAIYYFTNWKMLSQVWQIG